MVATDESTIEWLENSIAFREKDHFYAIFREFLSDTEVWEDGENVHDKECKKIRSYIAKLEAFAEFNQILIEEYKNKLDNLSKNSDE